jgi:hypothetical protein
MPNGTMRREHRLREKARRQGLSVGKSRVRTPHIDDLGGYMIVAHDWNGVRSRRALDELRVDSSSL